MVPGIILLLIIGLPQLAWDVSERSQSDPHWERHLRDLSETSQKRRLFWDVFKTSQIHLKKDVFFVTSLRRLKNDVFCMMSLRRFERMSKKMSFPWHLWDVPKTSLVGIYDFSKIPHKMVLCDFRRLTEIFGKIDVGPLETFKKWNEQCMVINQVCHKYQLADFCVRILES